MPCLRAEWPSHRETNGTNKSVMVAYEDRATESTAVCGARYHPSPGSRDPRFYSLEKRRGGGLELSEYFFDSLQNFHAKKLIK